MSETTFGAAYEATKGETTTQLAARVRAELRDLQRAGRIPGDVRVSVRKRSSAIDVVASFPRPIFTVTADEYRELNGMHGRPWVSLLTDEARAVLALCEEAHGRYNYDRSDAMTDYFDRRYWGRAELDTAPGVDRWPTETVPVVEHVEPVAEPVPAPVAVVSSAPTSDRPAFDAETLPVTAEHGARAWFFDEVAGWCAVRFEVPDGGGLGAWTLDEDNAAPVESVGTAPDTGPVPCRFVSWVCGCSWLGEPGETEPARCPVCDREPINAAETLTPRGDVARGHRFPFFRHVTDAARAAERFPVPVVARWEPETNPSFAPGVWQLVAAGTGTEPAPLADGALVTWADGSGPVRVLTELPSRDPQGHGWAMLDNDGPIGVDLVDVRPVDMPPAAAEHVDPVDHEQRGTVDDGPAAGSVDGAGGDPVAGSGVAGGGVVVPFPGRDEVVHTRAGAAPACDPDGAGLLVLSHSFADGTLLRGTSKGDGSAAVLKRCGWRWFGSLGCWGVQRSRFHVADRLRIGRTVEQLTAAGFRSRVEIDDTPGDRGAAIEAGGAASEVRAERLDARAEQLAREAHATHTRARAMADVIPFGQPVLTDHYSARRDRNYRDKIGRTFEQSFRLDTEARDTARAAAAVTDPRGRLEDRGYLDRKVRQLEQDLGRCDRARAEAVRAGRGYTVSAWEAQAREDLVFYSGKLAEATAAAPQVAGPDTVKVGDYVRCRWGWCRVAKVNRKTVAVDCGMPWPMSYRWAEVTAYRPAGAGDVAGSPAT